MTTPIPDVLQTIIARKHEEVAAAKAAVPHAVLDETIAALAKVRSLRTALQRSPGQPIRVLAEIKRASPSAGPIRPDADPVVIAKDYVAHGAAALSVLTDRDFFDGRLEFLGLVRPEVAVPLLRKDFIVDSYQIAEARAAGADAILLIVAALTDVELATLLADARRYGLEALVEVHDEDEAACAIAVGADLIGINHRNLRTFTVDLGLTERIAPTLPAGTVIVAESGIRDSADVERMARAGAHAVLVGESLMRQSSPGQGLAALLSPTTPLAPSVGVKICGVTAADDAAMVAHQGTSYIGLNCWPESRRFVNTSRLALLAATARSVAPKIQVVGLFVDAYLDQMDAPFAAANFDIFQLHGDEDIEQCRAVRARFRRRVWKAIPLGEFADLATIAAFANAPDTVDAIVLDAPSAGRGGSGQRIDLSLAAAAIRAHPHMRFVLAGGLTAGNVRSAIDAAAPWVVDVASGVEVAAGLKDAARVAEFLAAVAGPATTLPDAAEPVAMPPSTTFTTS